MQDYKSHRMPVSKSATLNKRQEEYLNYMQQRGGWVMPGSIAPVGKGQNAGVGNTLAFLYRNGLLDRKYAGPGVAGFWRYRYIPVQD